MFSTAHATVWTYLLSASTNVLLRPAVIWGKFVFSLGIRRGSIEIRYGFVIMYYLNRGTEIGAG